MTSIARRSTRSSTAASTSRGRAHRHRDQDVVVAFALLLVLGAALHLVHAQGHRRHAEPHRPEPRRARSACSRRSPTASSCSSRSSRSRRRPTGPCSGSRRTCRSCPRSSLFCDRPDRRRGLDPRPPDVPAGRRSRRSASLCLLAMSGIGVYGVMLAGWSSGSKYPLLGSVRAIRAAALVRSRVRARDRSACSSRRGTLSTRGIVDAAGAGTAGDSIFTDWYWLPAIVAVRRSS